MEVKSFQSSNSSNSISSNYLSAQQFAPISGNGSPLSRSILVSATSATPSPLSSPPKHILGSRHSNGLRSYHSPVRQYSNENLGSQIIARLNQLKIDDAKQYFSGMPELLNVLTGVICEVNFDREYQLDNYSKKIGGIKGLVDELVKFNATWMQYKNVNGFKETFKHRFHMILEFCGSNIESAKNSQHSKKQSIDEMDNDSLEIHSPTNQEWLKDFKTILNIEKVVSTKEYPTRQPTENDIIAFKFLEELIFFESREKPLVGTPLSVDDESPT